MTGMEIAPTAAALMEGARRDLSYAEELLAGGGDRLLALVVVARAARRADDATFALLDGPQATPRPNQLTTSKEIQ